MFPLTFEALALTGPTNNNVAFSVPLFSESLPLIINSSVLQTDTFVIVRLQFQFALLNLQNEFLVHGIDSL